MNVTHCQMEVIINMPVLYVTAVAGARVHADPAHPSDTPPAGSPGAPRPPSGHHGPRAPVSAHSG